MISDELISPAVTRSLFTWLYWSNNFATVPNFIFLKYLTKGPVTIIRGGWGSRNFSSVTDLPEALLHFNQPFTMALKFLSSPLFALLATIYISSVPPEKHPKRSVQIPLNPLLPSLPRRYIEWLFPGGNNCSIFSSCTLTELSFLGQLVNVLLVFLSVVQ